MGIYWKQEIIARGCGYSMGGVLLLLLLSSSTPPTLSFRLQHELQNSGTKFSSNATNASSAPWPPRIPLWGFFPTGQHDSKRELEEEEYKFPVNDDQEEDLDWLANFKKRSSPSSPINGHRAVIGGGGGGKRNRIYDVPQIECPPADDGMERFACPTPDKLGRYPCVDDHVLCDGFVDCPGREDEDRQACMFYKTTKAHLDVLADALLRWARGRR